MTNIAVWFYVKLSWLFSLTLSEHIKMYGKLSKTNIVQHYTRNNKYPSNHDVDAATDPNILSFPLSLRLSLRPCLTVRKTAWRSCCQGFSRRWTPSIQSWRHCGAHRWSSRDSGTCWGSRGRIWRRSWHVSAQRPKEGTVRARENDRYTIHTFRHPWLFSSKLFRVQISNTCHSRPAMHPDDIWMKI